MKLSKRLVRPCKYIILRIFKLKFRKRLFIKFQRRKQQQQQQQQQQQHHYSPKLSTRKIVSFKSVLRVLRIRKKTRDIVHMDRIIEIKSLSAASAAENQEKSCHRTRSIINTVSTNNVTAGSENREKSCTRGSGGSRNSGRGSEEVEEACRSFENYLMEMIMEEGRMKDLMDVEQLLYCWNNLRCPVFIELVSTFYVELCKDLFSNN